MYINSVNELNINLHISVIGDARFLCLCLGSTVTQKDVSTQVRSIDANIFYLNPIHTADANATQLSS